jgi:hypothetical protein
MPFAQGVLELEGDHALHLAGRRGRPDAGEIAVDGRRVEVVAACLERAGVAPIELAVDDRQCDTRRRVRPHLRPHHRDLVFVGRRGLVVLVGVEHVEDVMLDGLPVIVRTQVS